MGGLAGELERGYQRSRLHWLGFIEAQMALIRRQTR
jgi:hypothetical protein